jgi:hypothetical protein
VTIRQITSATNPRIADADNPAGVKPTRADPRRVLGIFQHSFTVKPADQTLASAERLYAVFQWIDQAHSSTDRWSPVLARYLTGLADTITGLGGNPALIPPSWTGFRPDPDPGGGGVGEGGGGGGSGEGDEAVGKIEGIVYDRFGDIDGFLVRTDSGLSHRFHSREPAMRILVERAWAERTRIAVHYEPQSPHIPAWVTLLAGG